MYSRFLTYFCGWILIIIVALLRYSFRFKKFNSRTIDRSTRSSANRTRRNIGLYDNVSKVRSNRSSLTVENKLHDDLDNDWLAKQRREEARALSMTVEMFDLRWQHSNDCDAEYLRRFHESSCDAHGIDTGEK